MKILFLDVDGVLNTQATLSAGTSCWLLDENRLLLLKEIVDKTSCQIVLTSTWRCYEQGKSTLRQYFRKHGIHLWISQTKDLNDGSGAWSSGSYRPRKEEISQWLIDNQIDTLVDKIAILDDDTDACLVGDWFFRTSFNDGLTKAIADKIIHFLGEGSCGSN